MAKKKKGAPEWAYEDNAFSNFAIIYSDYITSTQYKSLSCSAGKFLLTCIIHRNSQQGKECLYNAYKTFKIAYDENITEYDLKLEIYNNENGLFVFPKKQLEKYGYTSAYASKCFRELINAGFIETVSKGQLQHKVNIYKLSDKWKKKKNISRTTNS